jgi:hypothetical protein
VAVLLGAVAGAGWLGRRSSDAATGSRARNAAR